MISTLTNLDLKVKDPAGKQTETLLKLSGCHIYQGILGYLSLGGRKNLRALCCPLLLYKGIHVFLQRISAFLQRHLIHGLKLNSYCICL